jgi:protein O-GlcNAc transferase
LPKPCPCLQYEYYMRNIGKKMNRAERRRQQKRDKKASRDMKSIEPTSEQTKMIEDAMALHQSGQLDLAEIQYKKLLNYFPDNSLLLTNLGTIAFQRGRLEEGVGIIAKSLQINSNQPDALNNRGVALQNLKRLDEALASYDRAIALNSDYAEAYYNRGVALQDLKRPEEALASYDRAIALHPDYVEAYYNRGVALQDLKRLDEALASYDRAIALHPDSAEAYYNRGKSLKDLNRLDEALASYDRAIALNPDSAEAYSNRGNVLQDLKRFDEALASHDRAIALNPDYAEAYSNRGVALQDLKRLDEALASYDRAIALNPDYAEAYSNRGNILQDLKRLDEALASYDRAIALNPDFAEAYSNRGNALKDLKRLDEALASYDRAIALKPGIDFILGESLHTKMHLCMWDNFDNCLKILTDKINNGENVSNSFPILALIDDPNIQRKTSEIYINKKSPQSNILPKIHRYHGHEKIRVGYFSADFHNHATMYLMAELFECHDRDKFELIAFSFGPDNQDEWRQRILLCFDDFVDVRSRSDRDIALLSRNMEIDIAVDLKGFTGDNRSNIFAEGSAPIQVNYLGYPGTTGATFMDYIIADRTLIPEYYQRYYSEKVVYLPNSYQVNTSKRKISNISLKRHDFGLPNTGFVFSCFNNNYKITPYTFSGWMKILEAVEGSVLWLFESNKSAVKNLKNEAKKSGINEDRLIFSKHITVEEHLNRIQLADLFLDTLPCNAHTTTSDALRMKLPVLTCMGNSFASRVSASLLNAVNLPELITTTQEQYESLAIQLALHPEKLKTIKDKLISNLSTTPLYDAPLFTRHLESAYLTMYERHQNELDPDHIYVEHHKI